MEPALRSTLKAADWCCREEEEEEEEVGEEEAEEEEEEEEEASSLGNILSEGQLLSLKCLMFSDAFIECGNPNSGVK